MKKNAGIFQIILGALTFSLSSYVVLVNTMFLEKATRITKITGNRSNELHLRNSRTAAAALVFISCLVIAGGYKLKKSAIDLT